MENRFIFVLWYEACMSFTLWSTNPPSAGDDQWRGRGSIYISLYGVALVVGGSSKFHPNFSAALEAISEW